MNPRSLGPVLVLGACLAGLAVVVTLALVVAVALAVML